MRIDVVLVWRNGRSDYLSIFYRYPILMHCQILTSVNFCFYARCRYHVPTLHCVKFTFLISFQLDPTPCLFSRVAQVTIVTVFQLLLPRYKITFPFIFTTDFPWSIVFVDLYLRW